MWVDRRVDHTSKLKTILKHVMKIRLRSGHPSPSHRTSLERFLPDRPLIPHRIGSVQWAHSPHVDYPLHWYGVTWFKGPGELQCDGTWVRRRRLDAALANRCPGEHSKIWPHFQQEVQAERWTSSRAAHGEPPEIPVRRMSRLTLGSVLPPPTRASLLRLLERRHLRVFMSSAAQKIVGLGATSFAVRMWLTDSLRSPTSVRQRDSTTPRRRPSRPKLGALNYGVKCHAPGASLLTG